MSDKNTTIQDIDFSQDINDFNTYIHQNDELYGEVHTVFGRVTGGGAGVLGMSSTTSIAELGRTLASIRSTSIDAVNKRFAAKKSIVEMKMKQQQMNNGETNGDELAVGRSILREVLANRSSLSTPAPAQIEDRSRELLDQRVNRSLENGTLKTTANERAMKYDFKQEVVLGYQETSKEIVALHKTNGTVIQDYPKDRIPRMRVIRIEGDQAITNTGINLPVVKG